MGKKSFQVSTSNRGSVVLANVEAIPCRAIAFGPHSRRLANKMRTAHAAFTQFKF